MNNKLTLALFGGMYFLGGVIIYKLKDIKEEIEYFERAKYVTYNRKEYIEKLNETLNKGSK